MVPLIQIQLLPLLPLLCCPFTGNLFDFSTAALASMYTPKKPTRQVQLRACEQPLLARFAASRVYVLLTDKLDPPSFLLRSKRISTATPPDYTTIHLSSIASLLCSCHASLYSRNLLFRGLTFFTCIISISYPATAAFFSSTMFRIITYLID
ncbi:hypothetical protein E1B28_006388 [Marasmius oreades]|uniref:Secreted protein n=1 Tax=Marasmius oreades TaxID=181124 RepID=A0A9P7UW53_9AGAR|nr:uncharacterized protein E1B28_006388 [Marasmius oreades]KAG7095671.1 hypothetical protein E1B28_006388 [Marasmius oreades]